MKTNIDIKIMDKLGVESIINAGGNKSLYGGRPPRVVVRQAIKMYALKR